MNGSELHQLIAMEIAMDYIRPSQAVVEPTVVGTARGAAVGIVDRGSRTSSKKSRVVIG